MNMNRLVLSEVEVSEVKSLLDDLVARYDTVEDAEFLREAAVVAHDLPRRVRQHLTDFKLLEPMSALCVISGYPIDEERIGDTPTHWKNRACPSQTLPEEMLLVLYGSLLGEPIAWATQQDGRLVHDILPIKGHENEQLGSGSEQLLWWHVEDAFHPYRGDYLGMMCLRNPDQVATTFASLENIELDQQSREKLFEPHYTIRPDESHLKKNKSEVREIDRLLEASYREIERMNTRPDLIPIFCGDRESPYIRLDPYFMNRPSDSEAQEAFERLCSAIEKKLEDLVLAGGDFCFIDNFKAVHGRRPFKARYDGKDRWLKRINVARDLRKSRSARLNADSRVIY